MEDTSPETSHDSGGKSTIPQPSAAESGAVPAGGSGADLSYLISRWPSLSDEFRRAIIAIVNAQPPTV